MPDATTTAPLRERKRRLLQREIIELALRHITDHGYDTSTVDEIAHAAGVSRRTFFRYFPTKEDVVIGYFDEIGSDLRAALAARPADEPPLIAIRRTFTQMLERHGTDRDLVLTLCQLTEHTPALRARQVDKQDRWRSAIVDVIAERTGGNPLDPQIQLLGRVALAVFDVSLRDWALRGGVDEVALLVDQTFDLLTELIRQSGR